MLRQAARDTVTVIAVVLAISLVIGQLIGQPVLLGYVTSGSMAPTLEAGDGFVAVPEPLSGEIEEGNVIVFEAVELQGGGLTTHRVVGVTEDGYITRGDNNPFRDQDGDEPVVTDDRVFATALQINGEVVRIPGLGTAIASVQTTATDASGGVAERTGLGSELGGQQLSGLFISLGLVLFLIVFVDDLRSTRQRTRDRTTSRWGDNAVDGRWVALALAFLILVPANAALLAPAGTHQVVADGDDLPDGTAPGERIENGFTVENSGVIAMVVMLETDHPDGTMDRNEVTVPRGESSTATLSVTAPPPGKQTVVTVSEHRYFLLLPPSVIVWLHSIHPLVAVAAFNLLVLGSVATTVGAVFGFSVSRVRDTSRDVPVWLRIKRLLK